MQIQEMKQQPLKSPLCCARVLSPALLRVPALALPMLLIPPNKHRMANLGREHSSDPCVPTRDSHNPHSNPRAEGAPTPTVEALHLCLPSVEEKREPEAVELVRDFRIEEREEPTDIIHAVHLGQKWVWRGVLLQAQGTLQIALEQRLPSHFSLNQVPGLVSNTNYTTSSLPCGSFKPSFFTPAP